MVKTTNSVRGKPLKCSLTFDGYLHKSLIDIREYIDKNFDSVGIITGEEGAGKTTLAMQISYFMDEKFSNDNIIFNARGFEHAIKTLPKGSVILWDEADDVGSNWASEMMITLKKTFKRIRKMNYFILLVTPTFHDLNKYFAIHRTRFLINVYSDFVTRGFFKFYNRKNKRLLYIHGKKEMNMSAWKGNFFGRFTDYPEGFPIDFERYESEKDKATEETMEKVKTPKNLKKDILMNLIMFFDRERLPYTTKVLAEIIGADVSTINRYRREYGGESQ